MSSSPDLGQGSEMLDLDDDLLFGSPIMPVLSMNVVSRCEGDVP